MFGSAILEVILGLAFVYFLLAVIASSVNEIIAGLLGWRSAALKTGIQSMLPDGETADAIWQHPLITGLGGKAGRAPSYVPASTFATALLDVVGSSEQRWAALPESTQKALASLNDAAGGDQARFKAEIANWFNAKMDRVTGVYKRQVMWLTLGVAAALTLLFGVDTIALATTIWQEQGLRAALSAGAQMASPGGIEDTLNTLSEFNLPIGWVVLPQTVFGWFLKVIGLLLTTLAVSLGAPFWFDVIKRFTNPRSSGPAPTISATTAPAGPPIENSAP